MFDFSSPLDYRSYEHILQHRQLCVNDKLIFFHGPKNQHSLKTLQKLLSVSEKFITCKYTNPITWQKWSFFFGHTPNLKSTNLKSFIKSTTLLPLLQSGQYISKNSSIFCWWSGSFDCTSLLCLVKQQSLKNTRRHCKNHPVFSNFPFLKNPCYCKCFTKIGALAGLWNHIMSLSLELFWVLP